ncbi:hypothetical protein PICSAR81_01881 [Mycobacterium avium subsp. paratuberculosis]|nr:hypothetical protein PICSAR81_01881 [Mycobacterium avium subsp. paratuberculosis]
MTSSSSRSSTNPSARPPARGGGEWCAGGHAQKNSRTTAWQVMTRPHSTAPIAHVRESLVSSVISAVGSGMTRQRAQQLLVEAKGWSTANARHLHEYLGENPGAFTAPTHECPAAFPRLLTLLAAAGHADAVSLLGCAKCGRTDLALRRNSPEGRCCPWCVIRTELRPCARCGEDGYIIARRADGPVCRRCYNKDPQFLQVCAGCGRKRPPNARRDDGTVLCQRCSLPPTQSCCRCGNVRRVHAQTADGPICRTCYRSPARKCGVCGEIAQIQARATDTHPDTCVRCYRNIGECVVCGRTRAGGKYRGGSLHCVTCWPHHPRHCDSCEKPGIACATWPLGTVCRDCYHRRRLHPQPCANCHRTAVMVGRNPDGQDICAPCCGVDLDFSCRTCGIEGLNYADGKCTCCVMTDRVNVLLSLDDGTVVPQLQPLADALSAANPESVQTWLQASSSARLLAQLVAERRAISHELLDELDQDNATRYIRQLLVTTGILTSRQEEFAQLQIWASRKIQHLPPHQSRVVRPFAEWRVIRDARKRAARRRYTIGSAANDRQKISTTIAFLTWLDDQEIPLDSVTQLHLDRWLDAHPTKHKYLAAFIGWLEKQRLTQAELVVPQRRSQLPSRLLSDDELEQQLKRCLTDDTLPLDVRVVGALIRLYAPPLVRIAELTTDRYHTDDDGSYLTIGRHPVLLPPTLARLIEQLIARGPVNTLLRNGSADNPAYLLAGRPPSRPVNPRSLQQRLTKHGLPVIHARNTAMITNAATLPPPVVAELFGIHPTTAYQWAQYAQSSWAAYLQACQSTAQPGLRC